MIMYTRMNIFVYTQIYTSISVYLNINLWYIGILTATNATYNPCKKFSSDNSNKDARKCNLPH